MKLFITFSFLIAVIVPLCSGLKCLTCDADLTTPNEKPASCTVGQVPGTRECTTGCYASVTEQRVAIKLGCTDTVNTQCTPSSNPSGYRDCSCGSDLCNNPEGLLTCLACEGKPVGSKFETDSVCKKGETPTEKRCLVGLDICFNRWTATETTIGCAKYNGKEKLPTYNHDGGTTKTGICNTNNCNTNYEDPTTKNSNIGEMKSPLFSLVFAVAISSIYYHQ